MHGAWSAGLAPDDVEPRGVLTAILDHQKRGANGSIVSTSASPARCEVAVTDLSAGGRPLGGGDVTDGWEEAICGYPLLAYGRTQSDELGGQLKSTRLLPRSLIYTPHDLRPCQWALAAPARRRRNGRASLIIAPQSPRTRSSAGRLLRVGPALAAPLRGRRRPGAESYARSSPGVRRSPLTAWQRFVWC